MNDRNAYTGSLWLIGIGSLTAALAYVDVSRLGWALPFLVLILLLDLFPIRLLSGDHYSAGLVGILVLLFAHGWSYAVIGSFCSVLAYFLHVNGGARGIRWFPLFATTGMYAICTAAAWALAEATAGAPMYLRALATAAVFEALNLILYAGILRTIRGTPLFADFRIKLQETVVPIVVCIVAVPHFLEARGAADLAEELVYAGLLLFAIIYFSRAYTDQARMREDASKAFIRLMESRIASRLEGHGARVGMICEALLPEFLYPKRRRSDLVQAAILHDIGKSLLPSHVFTKRGALTLTEEKLYQSHCEKGADILDSVFPNRGFGRWVRHHHESFDGKGFPEGMKGTDIPLESRILAVCNQLDHTMARHADDRTVLNIMQGMSGKQLDPSLVASVTLETIAALRARFPERETDRANEAEPEASDVGEEMAHLGESRFLRFRSDERFDPPVEAELADRLRPLARASLAGRRGFPEHVRAGERMYEAHFLPSDGEAIVFLHDLTPMLQFRSDFNVELLKSYRDIVQTLTEDKVTVCVRKEELERELGRYVASMEVRTNGDVPRCRAFVAELAERMTDGKQKMKLSLAVSEGATNTLKHATGGVVSVYEKADRLQVLIADRGSGIPLHELPKTILVMGYSSKRSLGKGFSLMYYSADRLAVYTSPQGTSVLLEFRQSFEPMVLRGEGMAQ